MAKFCFESSLNSNRKLPLALRSRLGSAVHHFSSPRSLGSPSVLAAVRAAADRDCTQRAAQPSSGLLCNADQHRNLHQQAWTRANGHHSSRGALLVANAGGGGGLAKRAPKKRRRGGGEEVDTLGKKVLVGIAFGYLGLILFLPTLNIFYQAFRNGLGPFLYHLTDPDFLHAAKMTLLLTAVAVPINTLVGITAAINITRNEFPGKALLVAMLDLPFSISPVVTGLMLVLLYGREGLFAPVLRATGFNVVFAFPGMALATLFVTMPFVVRELIPVLEAMDLAEEEAALTLGASSREVFWNVTLPNIRWGLMYGVLLTNARAMGEFGAVSVISGNIIGRTQTLTLFVESAYKEYNSEGAFSAAVLLTMLAVGTIFIKDWIERQHLSEK